MPTFAILTNRKRAIIALVHTIAFLSLAVRDLVFANPLSGILPGTANRQRSLGFAVVYLAVTIVLGYLLRISGSIYEQLYFGLCTASASSGLLRAVVGDGNFLVGQYLRVGLLSSAVVIGCWIVTLYAAEIVTVRAPLAGDETGSQAPASGN